MALAKTSKYVQDATFSRTADVDLSAFQYGIVDFKAGDPTRVIKYVGTKAAGKLPPAGLLLNDPKAGEEALIYDLNAGGKLYCLFGAAVVIDKMLIVDANGKAVIYADPAAGEIVWVIGRTIEASGADGEVHPIMAGLQCVMN